MEKRFDTAERLQGMELSIMKQIEMRARNTKGIISLAQGIPSFDTPEHIKHTMRDAMQTQRIAGYGASNGLLELREALVVKLQEKNDISADAEKEVLITSGCMGALQNALLALVNKGEEVLMPNPSYTPHIELTKMINAVPRFFSLHENEHWEIDEEEVRKKITVKTKALLFSNPGNPAGNVYSKKTLVKLAGIAAEHNLFIISDDTYEYFIYNDEKHYSLASHSEFKENMIQCFSFSKAYAMSGYRIGYMTASEQIIKEALKVQGTFDICPPMISQHGALAAVTGSQECVKEFKHVFNERRKKLTQFFKQLPGVSFIEPQGAYYFFLKLQESTGIDGKKYVQQLFDEAHVAVVPGKSFGEGREGYFRVCFAMDDATIETAMERMQGFHDKKFK